ncbi:glycosyltransferase family 25 protein [Bremerella sp.]|uniref:glycosyltransferase family 25 protein n=1 Tax=Bremerella sp. TaxID=2795602 RepID=UPI00391B1F0F
MSLETLFSRVVCINLNSRTDRWDRIRKDLADVDWPFAQVERFRAVDGRTCPPPTWARNRYRECPGAWGCYQSHLRILEDTLLDDHDSVLILEDDALINAQALTRIIEFLEQVPDDWDHIYFGGEHMKSPVPVNDHVVRGTQIHRTHAHALRGDYLRQAYDYLIAYPTIDQYQQRNASPLAQFIKRVIARPKSLWSRSHGERSIHVDHHFGAIHRLQQSNVYAPTKWLVGQAADHSDIMNENYEERFWHELQVA